MPPTCQLFSIQLKSDLEEMAQLLTWFEQFNRDPISSQIWLEGQTALLEGFTNAVRHAHANLPPTTPVEVCVQITPQSWQVQIFDWGEPFDLEAGWQQLSQMVSHPDFDPLERDEHWGMLLLLKLKNDHGWSIRYDCLGPGEQGQEEQESTPDQRNCLILSHPL